jgi:hypothetical protein
MNRLLTAADVGALLKLSPGSIAALRRTKGLTATGPLQKKGTARYFTPLDLLDFLTAEGSERYAQTVVDALVPRPDIATVLAAFFGYEDPQDLEQDAADYVELLRQDAQQSAWANFCTPANVIATEEIEA